MALVAEFPQKLDFLFKPAPYKSARGGRGSGKSWGFARALLILGLQRPIRVLCARETQSSLRESVHQLLVDQIARLGFAGHYRIQQVQITGPKMSVMEDGKRVERSTEFVFCGLSDQTAASIKSFESADICWVEEAQMVSDLSWTILIPTIHRPGSEIWLSWNPELDNDPTWKRFVEHPPNGTVDVEMNWQDNPWFTAELNEKRLHDEATLKDYEYEWIWNGRCKPAITGAIYADDLAKMVSEKRVCDVPYDPTKPVYAVFDLGFNDFTSIIVCQRHLSSLRIIDYHEANQQRADAYSAWLRARPYPVTEIYLPHDGAHDHLSGQSFQRDMEDLKWMVTVLPPQDPEDGIRAVRNLFPGMYIDSKLELLVDHLKRYRRAIPRTTNEPSKPLHDAHSHACDALRYCALAAPQMDRVFITGGGLQLPKLKFAGGL